MQKYYSYVYSIAILVKENWKTIKKEDNETVKRKEKYIKIRKAKMSLHVWNV